jgi:ubiquinone biosynthesis protein
MIRPGAIERLERNARRVQEIVTVLVKYGLADWLRKVPGSRMDRWLRNAEGQTIPELSRAERIRFALTELGTTFIKLGQALSTRPDFVGEETARELGKLQSEAPPEPPGVAEATLEEELGRRPRSLFAHFERVPFASASIAQVHHARLRSGEEVVVKIQREGIEKRIETDLSILADLAELAEKHVEELKPYRPVETVRQLAKTLRGELDFARERGNLEEFRRNFAEDEGVRFPRPWNEFSSRRVLTMERMEGILVSRTEELRASGADLDGFSRRGAQMYLEMIFRDSFYHADPHPGNLMLLPGEIVGVLDCGMVERLSEGLQEKMEDILIAVAQGDANAVADGLWNLSTAPPTGGREQLRSEVAELLAEYMSRSIKEVRLREALTSLLDIIYRNGLFLPSGVSLLLRTLVELEGTVQLLSPSFSLIEVIQPYYQEVIGRRFSPDRLARRLQRAFRDWDRLLQALPKDVHEIVQRILTGTLIVHLDHHRLEPLVNRLVLGLLTSALFLGSSLLWSMKAPPLIGGVSLLGVVGYALSLFLGFKVFRAVRKS